MTYAERFVWIELALRSAGATPEQARAIVKEKQALVDARKNPDRELRKKLVKAQEELRRAREAVKVSADRNDYEAARNRYAIAKDKLRMAELNR